MAEAIHSGSIQASSAPGRVAHPVHQRNSVMTYEETRDYAQLRELDAAIDRFIREYRKPKVAPRRRQTVILFPGGIGSQLKRSPEKYRDGRCLDPSTYEYVWLNCWSLIRAARYLR